MQIMEIMETEDLLAYRQRKKTVISQHYCHLETKPCSDYVAKERNEMVQLECVPYLVCNVCSNLQYITFISIYW